MDLVDIDLVAIAAYVIFILTLAQWVSREKAGHVKNTGDYFLAGKSLPWWAIGASLIAANISAEQIIGMSGSGFVIGLGIASYEWMAAATLLIVGKYFLPIFLRMGISTMPQYLEQRFDSRVRIVMAVFWLGVYVFVNLTSILWLGALAINTVTGLELNYALATLSLLAIAYSIYGGLKAIALTDIVQVAMLVLGGLLIAYLVLVEIGAGEGVIAGFTTLVDRVPEKFDMILSPDNPNYIHLPGLSVLLGGMWIMNLSYWGFNQYIIQRALAAKSIQEAQRGIAFAAYLKLLMPVIVVLPGIAAVLLAPDIRAPDQAYPEMMKLAPDGIRGIIFAALIAAILSSLGSMMNSISTIFTVDLYSRFSKQRTERELVNIGRVVAVASIAVAAVIAQPLLGRFDQAFQYIQEFTGFFTPGIVTIFLLGMFFQRITALAALASAIGSALFSFTLYIAWPSLPFMDRVGVVFLLCVATAISVSAVSRSPSSDQARRATTGADVDYSTTVGFNIASIGVLAILVALYLTWW